MANGIGVEHCTEISGGRAGWFSIAAYDKLAPSRDEQVLMVIPWAPPSKPRSAAGANC
jgi:hypothetical protein